MEDDEISEERKGYSNDDLLSHATWAFDSKQRPDPVRDQYGEVAPALYKAAQKVISLIGDRDDQLLFVGKNSTWIFQAVKILSQARQFPEDHFVSLNFSGTPDCRSFRNTSHDRKNVITPERLSCFEKYLASSGLKEKPRKLYIVDLIGHGGGLNSFLRILNHYYLNVVRAPMPDVRFVGVGLGESLYPNVWNFNSSTGKLNFRPDESVKSAGIINLSIDAIPLDIPEKVVKILEAGVGALVNSGSPNYADQWNESYFATFNRPKPLFEEVHSQTFSPVIHGLMEEDNFLDHLWSSIYQQMEVAYNVNDDGQRAQLLLSIFDLARDKNMKQNYFLEHLALSIVSASLTTL